MPPIPKWLAKARSGWNHTGAKRPDFAIEPKPGQESVWDYPRPPRLARDSREVIVRAGEIEIARSIRSVRVLETASPPTFYLPREDVRGALLVPAGDGSMCEWKGVASYWNVALPEDTILRAAWSYEEPFDEFYAITGFVSFYPALLNCSVGGIPVEPQPGEFYGGWVTPEVVGPFKGQPGSSGW